MKRELFHAVAILQSATLHSTKINTIPEKNSENCNKISTQIDCDPLPIVMIPHTGEEANQAVAIPSPNFQQPIFALVDLLQFLPYRCRLSHSTSAQLGACEINAIMLRRYPPPIIKPTKPPQKHQCDWFFLPLSLTSVKSFGTRR